MLAPYPGLALSAADSARAAASVYTMSLLATAPIIAAMIAAAALRRSSAEARVLVWRAALGVLLLGFVGRALPWRIVGLTVPSLAAEPLIALGRVQVSALGLSGGSPASSTGAWIQLALAAYAIGVAGVLMPTVIESLRARRMLRTAQSLDGDAKWATDLSAARRQFGVRRRVHLAAADDIAVPVTWGLLRPVVLVPSSVEEWSPETRRMVVLHELAHVGMVDWAFGVASRGVCALYWFHPGVWWIARSLRRDAEQAADDRVIASGVARSDYAELLVSAAVSDAPALGAAMALSARGALRSRLAAILDLRHDVRPIARRWTLAAASVSVLVAAPLAAVELAPSRDVLSTLMRDSRWESRAYAVIGLAHRSDTVAVARTAAELDPSPRVRAWARFALGLQPESRPTPPVAEAR